MDDMNEISIENIIGPDFVDEQYDIGTSDDLLKDDEDDQDFNEELNQEIEHGTTIVCEPEPPAPFDDEEKDSGLGESDISDMEEILSTPPSIIPKPVPTGGRGWLRRKAMDEFNQPLPSPVIRYVAPEPGFYTTGLKRATLPLSYYRKREDPEMQKQRRALYASSPLIDFKAPFKQISFIVDQDDLEKKGYQHACKRLQEIQPDLELHPSKFQYDIWSFGLDIYSIVLEKSVSCSLLDLIPQHINNEENRPFWFMFKRLPTFQDSKLRDRKPKQPDERKGTSVVLNRAIYADLSYGALTSMSRFCVHKEYIFRKRTKWSIYFHDEFFEIQTIQIEGLKLDNTRGNLINVKYKIPLDIIDRAAIIHLWNDGFSLYLNMKGNVHVLQRNYIPKNSDDKPSVPFERQRNKNSDNNTFVPFKRQGLRDNKPMPLFSTIRVRMRLKNDLAIIELLEREGKITTTTSSIEKDRLVKETREESLDQIREAFKNFLDFFSNNRIHICFGAIYQKLASLEQLHTLDYQIFPTFIQSYSWAMLCNIGFRLQMQLNATKTFITQLHNYSKKKYNKQISMKTDDGLYSTSKYVDETSSEIDDRFYRLCLYLHRRSSEYFFLDLDQEIEIGMQEFDAKYKRSKQRKLEMSTFTDITSSTAYIPSVVLTPTTIKIRPLKLCKLNRVLREKLFGGVLNFALIELRDEAQRLLFPSAFRSLKEQTLHYLTNGINLTPTRVYKYLHHSQSQVKCKQFWFYYHDRYSGYLSHEDAYVWMGNFDKERVVAKHAARIALCFTSTDPTIRIFADQVTYDRDVKDVTKKYAFTDGVGTISSTLRDEIKDFLKRSYEFSVIQIRYGGCKGTLSVDPNLDGQQYQLKIRDSMNKFTTDHDILEVCKLSAPRPLYLNRQDIVLLESRDIPHTNFLDLQNKDHLWLVQALLDPFIAYELLQEKLLPVFRLRRIVKYLNIVEEQFFIKLMITCAFNIIRELLDRTRIRISDKKARNMFGIVDEYGVLEYGQVFVQYTNMRENKIDLSKEKKEYFDSCEILVGKVVITKNPCHHPGDLRTFDAVDHPELRHLKDVVVFPQKGRRPHSNEISGSDLDGDEYVVIWHEDLIPTTPNETPYDYDSQEDPPKMTRPITRDDINQIVIEVSEQDCLGTLSNIHLAYADKEGIKSEKCTKLAGFISQEVDAAKTGKHPLSEEEIAEYRDGLKKQWPDFMKSRGKRDFYPSERVLGKLYRSARRAETGWSRAISNHSNPRHTHLPSTSAAGTDIKDQENGDSIPKRKTSKYPLDPYIYHPDAEKYLPEIKFLYKSYQDEMLEIISLYRFQDEIDLFCRSESMDASGGGSKKGSLEDSAATEVQNLIQKITKDFYFEFEQRVKTHRCCKYEEVSYANRVRRKRIDCDVCFNNKLAKAACAYIHSYNQSNRLPLKSNRRILSFPWIFSGNLLKLRERNQQAKNVIEQRNTIVGRACSLYLNDFTPKFKVFISEYVVDIPTVDFYYTKIEEKRTSLLPINRKADEAISSVPLLRACFVEILNDWLIKQGIFGDTCIETDSKPLIPKSIWHELLINFLSKKYQPKVRLICASKDQNPFTERYRQIIERYRVKWTNTEYEELQKMFDEIHSIAVEHAKTTKLTIWTYLDEYIILALQCIGIEKRLVDQWICPPKPF